MGRTLRVAVVLSVFVVSMAIGAAKSDLLLWGEPVGDDEPLGFWETVYLTAVFAAWPLAMLWLVVFFVFLGKRSKTLLDEG